MRDLGPLGHCLVEEEGATLRSSQRRRVSLLISVFLQAAVLGALLLVPLLVNGERPFVIVDVASISLPPPHGIAEDPRKRGGPPSRHHAQKAKLPLERFQPKHIPPDVSLINDLKSGRDTSESVPPGVPGGTGQPDGSAAPFWSSAPQAPAPPPEPPRRIRLSTIDPGKILHKVQPVYPQIARQARIEGEVRLRALIGTDGNVREVVVLSGHPLLSPAAREAVQQWRYQPTLLNGQPVEVETQITVVFILNR